MVQPYTKFVPAVLTKKESLPHGSPPQFASDTHSGAAQLQESGSVQYFLLPCKSASLIRFFAESSSVFMAPSTYDSTMLASCVMLGPAASSAHSSKLLLEPQVWYE